MVQTEDAASRVGQVMAAMQQRIASRALAPGARLPSVRALAASMRLSPSTVVEAYDRLRAEGAIAARRGSGFYVVGHLPPLALADMAPRLDRAIDPLWVSRQSLDAGEGVLRPGCGWLPADWMPQDSLRRALRSMARAEPGDLADYGTALGSPQLRQVIARRIADGGVAAAPDQIVLTDSGTHAIDLVCRFLLEPGDSVIVDDPCYFNFQALMKAHRARVVGVAYTPNGPDVDAFAAAVAEHRPRLYITNSAVHNPTGARLAPAVAHRLMRIAEDAGLTIVEDDIFADFEEERAPRLAALDGLRRVIHIGSFSKTLSAAVRCGYIAVRRDWVEGLIDLKIATTFGGARLSTDLVLSVLTGGAYRRHVEMLRQRLRRASMETAARLKGLGIVPWLEPQAGMFLWCRLPDGQDAAALAQRALAENVVLAPGNVFSPSLSAAGFMRFNVSQCGDPRLYEVIGRAMAASS